jgi:hypothetical protein
MHGNVQRVGGHHGRDSSQTGCATPITADALTGPKYRLSNDAGLVTLKQEQFAGFEAAALLPGWQRPTPAVGRQHGGRRHAVDADARPAMHTSCGATAPTRLSSGTRAGR